MAQNFTADCFAGSQNGQTSLQNMENNFLVLKSLFSGASAPSNAVAGMPWFDTSKKLLKIRNNANSAWLGVLYGTSSLKTWLYLNAAQDGWAVDSGVTDKVLAIKGGAQAYNTSGATTAGAWTISGFASHTHTVSLDHNHKWWNYTSTISQDNTFDSNGNANIPATTPNAVFSNVEHLLSTRYLSNQDIYTEDMYTDEYSGGSTTGSETPSQNGTWRPAAAIGTLQYPDV